MFFSHSTLAADSSPNRSKKPSIPWWLVFIGIFIIPSAMVNAHEIRPTIVNLNLTDSGYELDILLNLEAIMAEIGPEHVDTDESENASLYDNLRGLSSAELKTQFDLFQDQLMNSIEVTDAGGEPISHQFVSIDIPETGDTSLARDTQLRIQPQLDEAISDVIWSWPAKYGDSIIRVNQADGAPNEDDYSAYLANGEKSRAIPLSGALKQTSLQVIVNYLKIGFEHIVPKGLDHILFVVGLFLLGAALRPLIIQITSFTLAHTITLALGTTGIIQLSPSIVEPLIAASIVYVAVENIISDRLQRWRPVIVFCFGLLHGLGFAGVLSEIGIASGFFFTALISFNLGVEFGQIFVILICFLAVGFWFRHKPWYRQRITIPGSLIVGAFGLFWFVERVFG